jgi:hypothetical protein
MTPQRDPARTQRSWPPELTQQPPPPQRWPGQHGSRGPPHGSPVPGSIMKAASSGGPSPAAGASTSGATSPGASTCAPPSAGGALPPVPAGSPPVPGVLPPVPEPVPPEPPVAGDPPAPGPPPAPPAPTSTEVLPPDPPELLPLPQPWAADSAARPTNRTHRRQLVMATALARVLPLRALRQEPSPRARGGLRRRFCRPRGARSCAHVRAEAHECATLPACPKPSS